VNDQQIAEDRAIPEPGILQEILGDHRQPVMKAR